MSVCFLVTFMSLRKQMNRSRGADPKGKGNFWGKWHFIVKLYDGCNAACLAGLSVADETCFMCTCVLECSSM